MDILIILASIGIIFAIGKFSIKQQLISKAFIDYSKPVGAIVTFFSGLLVTVFILLAIVMILFFLSTIL